MAAIVLALAAQARAGGRVVAGPLAAPISPVAVPVATLASPLLAGPGPSQLVLTLPEPLAFNTPAVLRAPEGAPLAGLALAVPKAAPAASPEAEALAASVSFDGRKPPESMQLVLPFPELKRSAPPPKSGLPSYLSAANPGHEEWLAGVVREAWRSKTGRRVLRQASLLSIQLGRPITVVVEDLRANNGEYVYDWDVVRMGRHYVRKEPVEAAATLIHELLHVVQKSLMLPVDAFEMELEAYGVTFEVMRELGLPFEKNSFYRSAYRKFHGPLDEYLRWLLKEYNGNIPLVTSKLSAYVKELTAQRDKTLKRLAAIDKKIASAREVVAAMERTNQKPEAVEHYRLDVLGKLALDRRSIAQTLAWQERDLEFLSSPEGRERYRRFARRVLEYTRRLHARYNAEPDWKKDLK